MQERVVFPRGRFLIQAVKTSGVNSPDRSEDVLHPYHILEALENFFGHELWIVRPQKLAKNDLLCYF